MLRREFASQKNMMLQNNESDRENYNTSSFNTIAPSIAEDAIKNILMHFLGRTNPVNDRGQTGEQPVTGFTPVALSRILSPMIHNQPITYKPASDALPKFKVTKTQYKKNKKLLKAIFIDEATQRQPLLQVAENESALLAIAKKNEKVHILQITQDAHNKILSAITSLIQASQPIKENWEHLVQSYLDEADLLDSVFEFFSYSFSSFHYNSKLILEELALTKDRVELLARDGSHASLLNQYTNLCQWINDTDKAMCVLLVQKMRQESKYIDLNLHNNPTIFFAEFNSYCFKYNLAMRFINKHRKNNDIIWNGFSNDFKSLYNNICQWIEYNLGEQFRMNFPNTAPITPSQIYTLSTRSAIPSEFNTILSEIESFILKPQSAVTVPEDEIESSVLSVFALRP